jgi:hypothetical protein
MRTNVGRAVVAAAVVTSRAPACVDRLVDKACAAARQMVVKGATPAKRGRLVESFIATVHSLTAGRWSTAAHAGSIETLARTL